MKKNKSFDNCKNIEQTKNIQKRYISFRMRIIITSVLAFIFLFCSIFLILNSLSVVKLETINYKETSNIDYKVYLKDTDLFKEEYLDKNMTYVASLIKNIKLNFNYLFSIDKPSSMDITYDIKAELIISNPKTNKIMNKLDYTLVEPVKDTILESNLYSINRDIIIDYDYYNNIANRFKYGTGVEMESYLNVYLTVKGENKKDNPFKVNNEDVVSFKIPLSEKVIELDTKNLNKNNSISANQQTKVNNRYKLFIGFIFAFLSLIFIVKLLKLLSFLIKRKSKYDKYINKLLREYDRLIINTRTPPKLDGFNVIKLDSFQELLDARDNVKGAIKYYVVTEHQKCNFYFTHDNDLYLLIIKEVDIDNL